MEVTEKEDGDSFIDDDSPINNCIELTANIEKLNFNVENSYKDHTTFNKSPLLCKGLNYSEFNLITNLTTFKVTSYDSNKQNITSSVISYRMRGVRGWQQKI